ncbi:MAG TPA: tRNA 2-thiouridine(34) synthase MnmA [Verrucomicrobiae bacterium]|jgi:tRNA-specific 2-thiouridylase|nr:tRNA 2-thiouridine(34) synthase MnmA [Verrucomicrobiae bacterium]
MNAALPSELVDLAIPATAEVVAVAMSGGVDSSVVAALMQEQRRTVIGLTMQLWNQRRLPTLQSAGPAQHRCCSIDDVYDAKRVAQHLDFPHYVVNFEDQFESRVIRPFVDQYLSGRTPIACTHCNTDIKFDPLLRMARQIGAARLATGHYARIRKNGSTGRWELLRARDESKDQSYFLWGLTQEQLSNSEFPLGELTKEEVRAVARRVNLPVAEKPESMELCFVPSGNYVQFIHAYASEQNMSRTSAGGDIVTEDGEILAHHDGVHHFTIGQRKGLGFSTGKALYVLSIDAQTNRVVVGEDQSLHKTTCEVANVNWVSCEMPTAPLRTRVKIRHKHESALGTVEALDATTVRVVFDTPQRAITAGQAAVLYDADRVLAGGWIR